MRRNLGELVDEYRSNVKWGMYEEAARLHREMIGEEADIFASDLKHDLKMVEDEPKASGFGAIVQRLFGRKQNH